MTSEAVRARKLAVFAIIVDILTFSVGFGFIFVAIGHDANSSIECTSANGLCGPLASKQSGSSSCAIAAGSSTCTKTITFSPAFGSTPTITLTNTFAGLDTVIIPSKTVAFFALTSTGQTWTAMPAALTEIFGDTTHEVSVDLRSIAQVNFMVSIGAFGVTGSSLRPQYTVNAGVTWTDLAQTAGQLTVLIDGTASCGNLVLVACSGFANIATAAQISQAGLRIVGAGGDGVTSPNFIYVQLDTLINMAVSFILTQTSLSVTSLSVQVADAIGKSLNGATVTFAWQAELK